MRRSDLTTPFRGVRETAPQEALADRCRSLAHVLRDDAYFCGPTAALLWGIPLPARLASDARLHVGFPHRQRPTRLTGTIGHHYVITAAELTLIDGLPATTAERTWCDLAPLLTLEELVAAGDRVLWHRDPLAASSAVTELARRHPGRRGTATRIAALAMLSDRSDSAPESILRIRLASAGLPPIHPNHEIRSSSGSLLARIDLAFVRHKVGVEYEGDHHRADRAQWRKDVRRFPMLEDEGWAMLRATGDDLANHRLLVHRIRTRLRARGWSA